MTKQEIKDLIAAKIAGQGNQVDIGGVLADILNALVDGGSQPIRLTGTISEGDTLQDLIEVGLTKEEIEAAARGERTGVVVIDGSVDSNNFYQITGASYYPEAEGEWLISFVQIEYEDNGIISGMSGMRVTIRGDIANVVNAEI